LRAHLPPGNPRDQLAALQARQHVRADLLEEVQVEPPLLLLGPALFGANLLGLYGGCSIVALAMKTEGEEKGDNCR
jgi:hypothetical protein